MSLAIAYECFLCFLCFFHLFAAKLCRQIMKLINNYKKNAEKYKRTYKQISISRKYKTRCLKHKKLSCLVGSLNLKNAFLRFLGFCAYIFDTSKVIRDTCQCQINSAWFAISPCKDLRLQKSSKICNYYKN